MNIKLIKATTDDMDYVNSFKLKSINNIDIIYVGDRKVGVLEYLQKDGYIYLELIEIEEQYRKQGIAKSVVDLVKGNKGDIFGDCAPNEVSIAFRSKLGAEFEESVEDGLAYNGCIPFVLYA